MKLKSKIFVAIGLFSISYIFILYIRIHVLPYRYYKTLKNKTNVLSLYGWRIEPRDSYYVFSIYPDDTLSNDDKPIYFALINKRQIKLPKEITYKKFEKILDLDNTQQVKDSLTKVYKIFLTSKADRLISDLGNQGVLFINYGKKNRILFLYLPNDIPEYSKVIHNYKKLDSNWYFQVRLFHKMFYPNVRL